LTSSSVRVLPYSSFDLKRTGVIVVASLIFLASANLALAVTALPTDHPSEHDNARIEIAQFTEASKTAETEDTSTNEDGFLTRWHGIISDKIESMGESADRFLDPSITFDELNQTSVRLRLDIDAIEGEGTEFDPKVDIKWFLPAAEGRLHLLVSATDELEYRDGEGGLGPPLIGDDEEDATTALDFNIRDDEKWRLSASLGVKSDQAYTRFKLRRNFKIGERWSSRLLDRLTYFSDDGFENDFRLDFDRTLGRPLPDTREFREVAVGGDRRPWLFRSASRIRSFENSDSTLFDQRFSFFNRLSRRSAIAYEALAFGCSNPNEVDETVDCEEYQLRLRYKLIHPKYNWLAFEVWPIAAFPESNDFDLNAQLRLRIEIWLGRSRTAQGRRAVRF